MYLKIALYIILNFSLVVKNVRSFLLSLVTRYTGLIKNFTFIFVDCWSMKTCLPFPKNFWKSSPHSTVFLPIAIYKNAISSIKWTRVFCRKSASVYRQILIKILDVTVILMLNMLFRIFFIYFENYGCSNPTMFVWAALCT